MKHYLQAALWLLLAYHGIFFIVPAILGSLPIYLVLTEGARFNWAALLGLIASNAALFTTALFCYRQTITRRQAFSRSAVWSCLLLLAIALGIISMYTTTLWPLDVLSVILLAAITLSSKRIIASNA